MDSTKRIRKQKRNALHKKVILNFLSIPFSFKKNDALLHIFLQILLFCEFPVSLSLISSSSRFSQDFQRNRFPCQVQINSCKAKREKNRRNKNQIPVRNTTINVKRHRPDLNRESQRDQLSSLLSRKFKTREHSRLAHYQVMRRWHYHIIGATG